MISRLLALYLNGSGPREKSNTCNGSFFLLSFTFKARKSPLNFNGVLHMYAYNI